MFLFQIDLIFLTLPFSAQLEMSQQWVQGANLRHATCSQKLSVQRVSRVLGPPGQFEQELPQPHAQVNTRELEM